MHAANSTNLVVPTSEGGLYDVSGFVSYAANATGLRWTQIKVNGTAVVSGIGNNVGASSNYVETLATTLNLAAGDIVTLTAFQNRGGTLNVTGRLSIAKATSGPAGATGPTGPTGVAGSGSAVLFDSVLGADTASIDTGAGGIDTTYKEIEVFIFARTSEAVVFSSLLITVNNDGSAIYDRQFLRANDSTLSGGTVLAGTAWTIAAAGASCAAGVFAALRFAFPAYAETTGQKPGTGTVAIVDTTAANCRAETQALNYRSTTAISRLKVAAASGNLKAGTRLLIVGVK